MPLRLFFGLLAALMLTGAALADTLKLSSGIHQTLMIELYTSEGCSSCPPAERRLNAYRQNPDLWQTFIPMAFHVDYWNYLGWEDRFSKPAYAERQRHYARLRKARTIYTPAFFVNGENHFLGRHIGKPRANAVGDLALALDEKTIEAQFSPSQPLSTPVTLNLAILGMGLKTDIAAGENEGRQAQHEFVVLHHQRVPGKDNQWRTIWPRFNHQGARELAIAAWVSPAGQPQPLQAVGAYLPAGFLEVRSKFASAGETRQK